MATENNKLRSTSKRLDRPLQVKQQVVTKARLPRIPEAGMDVLLDINSYGLPRDVHGYGAPAGAGGVNAVGAHANNGTANNNNNSNNGNQEHTSIQLNKELASSDYWKQQLKLAQISRVSHLPHAYAKAYAKNLKMGKRNNPVFNSSNEFDFSNGATLIDATTELLQQQNEKNKNNHQHTMSVGSGGGFPISRKGDDPFKLDFKLNDEELLKEQESHKKIKFLEIEPSKQYWASLDFSSQGIFNVSSKLFNRYEFLTKLYLNNNNLTTIPKEIKKLRFLRVLDLSSNQLTSLPKEINQLFCLKYLYLFDNKLTTVPYEFGNLSELMFLGIEGNPFNSDYVKIIAEKGCKEFICHLRDNNPARKNQLEDLHSLRKWMSLNIDGELVENDKISLHSGDKSSFTVLSYNTLCHHYASARLFGYTPSWALNWDYRRKRIFQEVVNSNCDLICLQEVETQLFEEQWFSTMKEHGYRGVFYNKGRARRGGTDSKKVDGCAVFYRHSKFTLIDKVFIDYSSVLLGNERFKKTEDVFNRFTNKDNIAVVLYLEHADTKKRLILVNTHLHWDPAFNDVKTLQMAVLLEELQNLCKKYSKSSNSKDFLNVPVVISGDFNSQIHSAVYQLLANGTCLDHPDFKGVNYGKYTNEGFSQPFQFKSAYSSIGELPFTNFTPGFTEVIDYIWYTTQSIEVQGMLGKIQEDYLQDLVGFPDQNHSSDHIALITEMKFKNVDSKGGAGSNSKNRSRKI